MRRRTIGITILVVLAIAALAGIGFNLFQAGYAQGIVAEGGDLNVTPGYYPGIYQFGVIGIMFKALFTLLFLGLIARLFFFRRWAHHGPWGPGGSEGHNERRAEFRSKMENHLTEWHERAHAEPESEQPSE